MKISLIAAVASNRVIGNKYQLPWHVPEDLRYFREKTWGKAIILGHSTFASLPVVLDNRKCIVMSRRDAIKGRGDFVQAISVEHALDMAQAHAEAHGYEEIFVAGGSQIYQLFFPHAATMYLTEVQTAPEGDAFFPQFDGGLWETCDSQPGISASGLAYQHVTYKTRF